MHPHGKDLAKSNAGRGGFIAAAVLGAVHAAFSIYWAQGGTWLVWSLGSSLSAVTANRTSPERSAASSTREPPDQPAGAGISHGTSSAGTKGAPTSTPSPEVPRQRPASGLAEPIDADIAGDSEAPGGQAGPGLVVPPASAPSPLQDVLHGILGVERRTQHLVAERPQPAAQPIQLLRRDRAHGAILSEETSARPERPHQDRATGRPGEEHAVGEVSS